jgi:hypothetical protein
MDLKSITESMKITGQVHVVRKNQFGVLYWFCPDRRGFNHIPKKYGCELKKFPKEETSDFLLNHHSIRKNS